MSDTSEPRKKRSLTPNRLYTTFGEAHRNITSRSPETPRQSGEETTDTAAHNISPLTSDGDQVDDQLPSPSSPSSLYDSPESRRGRTSFTQEPRRSSRYEKSGLPRLPAAVYDPAAPGYTKHVHTGQTAINAEYEFPYEQQGPYTHYDDIVKNSPENSQLHEVPGNRSAQFPSVEESFNESLDYARYDISWNDERSQYRFLQRTSERDLSQALGEASGDNHPSFGLEINQPSHGRSSSVADYRPARTIPTSTTQQRRARRATNFYNDAAIHSGMQTEDNGIRVPTSPAPPGSSFLSVDETSRPQRPWSQLSDEQFSRVPIDTLAAMQGVRACDNSPEDWETVTDDQGYPKEPYKHSAIGKVIGGSSIADYSDRLLPEEAHHFDSERPRGESSDWWERRRGLGQPLGSTRATEGTASRYHHFQESPSKIRYGGFSPTQLRGVSAQDARSALHNRQELQPDQFGPSYELTDMRSGRENPMGRELEGYDNERSRKPFCWDRVNQQVYAHQAQRDAERAAAEPPHLGRPLSGFEHLKLSCGLISREDAYIIQQERRASGLEDQSETGNYVSHHSMVNPRYNGRRSVVSDPRRTALNSGPDHYTPLSPSTGHMVQVVRARGRPLYRGEVAPITPSSAASPSTFPYAGDYLSNEFSGRNPFMTAGERERERERQNEEFYSIDLQSLLPPQPAYLANLPLHGVAYLERGSDHAGSHIGNFNDNSEAELWRTNITPRDRNPCRVMTPLTKAARRKLDTVFWTMFFLNFSIPLTALLTCSSQFGSALSWITKGEVCHLRS